MSIKQASSIYRSLTEDQKKLVDDKQLSATLSVKDWTLFLRKAAIYDELGEKAARQYLFLMILMIVLVIVSIVLAIDYWQAGLPLVVGFGLILFYVIRGYRKYKMRDLTNHLRLFLLPLLFVLKDKAGEKAKMALKLDLRKPTAPEPVKEFQQDNRKIKLYQPNYVIGKVKLLDEAVLEFILNDDIRVLRIKKRSASGKTKIKYKNKVARHYFIRLSFPKKYYKTKNGAAESVRLSETDEMYICKLKVKSKTDKISEVVALDDFLKSVNELYELIEAKPGAKFPEAVAQKEKIQDDRELEEEEMEDGSELGMAVPFMVWHHTYFTDYDYDSFSSEGQYNWDDGDGADSFFDS